MVDHIFPLGNSEAGVRGAGGGGYEQALEHFRGFGWDAASWAAALEEHHLTPDWIVSQLKDVADNGDCGADRLAAIDEILSILESFGSG